MPFALRCYISVVCLAAVGILAGAPVANGDFPELAILCALAFAFERSSRVKYGIWTTGSMSLVISVVAMLQLPPSWASVVGLVSGAGLPRPASRWKLAFNIAMVTVVPAAGATTCYLLGGHDSGVATRFPEFLVPFAGVVAVGWILNHLMLAIAIGLSGEARFRSVVRHDVARSAMPFVSSSMLSLILMTLLQNGMFGKFSALLVLLPAYVGHWVLSQYEKEQAAYESTISALVQAVEIKDHYTRGHSERVARGAELIARRLTMADDRVAMLRYAGLLHDIGKLSIPTRLLAKTGKLTDDEYAQICQHPNHGVAVIRDITFLTEVYEGILYHHERLDGRGYPTGKSGDEIPEFARIIGVADAFDAMTSTRSYRAARPVSEALTELWRGAGTQFDPSMVRAFDEALGQLEEAGRPWQVTDEPSEETEAQPVLVEGDDGAAEVVEPVHEYSFGDHDDPAVGREWYGDRIGAGPLMLRERSDRTGE